MDIVTYTLLAEYSRRCWYGGLVAVYFDKVTRKYYINAGFKSLVLLFLSDSNAQYL
jgi:hypothetical protein